ncbi:MAG: porin family protein [Bacteriovoracaceae bacterium]|jgi:hypothetical protein|nr:porin family protein [Bacteriovoracaceae bacterium]
MFKNVKVKKIIVPIMFYMVGTFFVFRSVQAENINNLRPPKPATPVAVETEPEIVPAKPIHKDPPPASMIREPRIPNGLRKHSLGLGIGQTSLFGDFEELGENKITLDILYTYSASHSFDLTIDLHHDKYSFKEQWVQTSGLAIGIKAKAYQFDAFAPYGIFGFGFYAPRAKRLIDSVYVTSKGKLIFGWHLGAGADLKLNNHFSVGIQLQYHNPFDIKQEIGSEISGTYSKMLITGMYTF